MVTFFGLFSWERKLRKLRKNWDRLREKSLRKDEPIRRMALERLDRLEEKLRTLEEQRVDRMTRARLSKELEIGLEEVKALLKAEAGELAPRAQEGGQ